MEDLRATQERHLSDVLEGNFGSDIILTGPDGEKQNVRGQIRYFTERVDPETGETVVVHKPVVVLRISSLSPAPENGETWFIEMPVSPESGASNESFLFTSDRSKETGRDMGFIRLYPEYPEQSA